MGLVGEPQLTFQGSRITTKQYGRLNWFGPYLQSLNDEDRADALLQLIRMGDDYAYVGAGETAGVRDYGGPNPAILELTYDTVPRVIEIIRSGLTPILVIDEMMPSDWKLAQAQMDRLHDKLLRGGPAGEDLNLYVIYQNGWDSIFYGWDPDDIASFGRHFRELRAGKPGYLALEFQTGKIPLGGGITADWGPNGRMEPYDLVLAELNDRNIHDNNTWGVVERMIGTELYVRPDDDVPPADGGDKHPRPYYLGNGTTRGPWAFWVYEWAIYEDVHGRTDTADVEAQRQYLKGLSRRFLMTG